ncbi:MAG TPA: ABC transporter permease [Anaerolineales bacterium]
MKLFAVFKKDLLILLRSRAEMALLLLMPLAFIIPISLALGAGDGYGIKASNRMILLPVVDYDRGPRSQALLQAVGEGLRPEKDYGMDLIDQLNLSGDPACVQTDAKKPVDNPACVEKAGKAMLQRSWRSAVLVIPQGFSSAVDDGKQVEVTLLYDPAGDVARLQQIEGVVKGATIKMSLQNQVQMGLQQLNDLTAFAPNNVRNAIAQQTATPQPADQKPAINLEKVSPTNFTLQQTPDTYQQTIPGYTVMYVFFIITSMTNSIHAEQVNGTFRRLLTTPARRAELVGGKMLATLVIGLAQVFLLFLVGTVVFKLYLGKDPLAFFLLTIALVASATSIGLAASTTRGRGLVALLIISALLGGCMFPLDLMPPILRTIGLFLPHSWALTGYQNLMVRGQGLQEVLPQIAALLGFAVIFFLIAVRRFKFENQEAG